MPGHTPIEAPLVAPPTTTPAPICTAAMVQAHMTTPSLRPATRKSLALAARFCAQKPIPNSAPR